MRVGLGYVRSVGEEEAKAVAASGRRGRSRTSATSRGARRLDRARARGARRVGRLRPLRRPRRELLWELGLVAAAAERARAAARSASSRCRSSRPRETPELPEQTPGSGCSPTTARPSLSVGVHPLELLRPHLPRADALEPRARASTQAGEVVAVAGMAVARQRPATANGVVFMLLEDELGQMNLIVPPPVYERFRALVRGEPLLLARGRFERVGPEPERPRARARDARPARSPLRGRRRGRRLAPGRTPLRPPLKPRRPAPKSPYPHPEGGAATHLPRSRP